MADLTSLELRQIHKGFLPNLGHSRYELFAAECDLLIASATFRPERTLPASIKIDSAGSEFLRAGSFETKAVTNSIFALLDVSSEKPVLNIVGPAMGLATISIGKPKDNGAPSFYRDVKESYELVLGPDKEAVVSEIHPTWKDSDREKGIVAFITLRNLAEDVDPDLALLATLCRAIFVS